MTTFGADVQTAVLAHMNGDHADDNLVIVRAFGAPGATSARMIAMDATAGEWQATDGAETVTVRVPWSIPVRERADIRRAVVMLYRSACEELGIPTRDH
jgi:hypothetical protein